MKLLRVFWLLCGLFLSVCSDIHAAGLATRILVIVNKDAITASDLEQRIRLINLSAGRPVNTPLSEDIRKQVIQSMIDELLQLQAARSKKIKIDDKEVENSFTNLAKENNMSLDAMVKMLKSNGISKQTMLTRLKAQMAWGRYIRELYGPLVHIHDDEVDKFLIKAKDVKIEEPSPELMDVTISQVIFDVRPDTPEEVLSILGPKIEETHQAKGCAAFVKAAQGFGAKVEANRVVKLGQLPGALKSMVKQSKPGACMQPTMTPDGLVLTMVCSKSMPKVAPPPAPTRDTASVALEQEKLGKRAAQEMAKLRAAAFIEQKRSDLPLKGKQPLLKKVTYPG